MATDHSGVCGVEELERSADRVSDGHTHHASHTTVHGGVARRERGAHGLPLLGAQCAVLKGRVALQRLAIHALADHELPPVQFSADLLLEGGEGGRRCVLVRHVGVRQRGARFRHENAPRKPTLRRTTSRPQCQKSPDKSNSPSQGFRRRAASNTQTNHCLWMPESNWALIQPNSLLRGPGPESNTGSGSHPFASSIDA